MFQKIKLFVFGISLVALAACGSSSGTSGTGTGSSSSSALEVAEKVSVVDASSSSTSASVSRSVGKILAMAAKAVPPSAGAGSDWNNDTTKTFVFERSTESFDTINEILCNIAQTQYDEKLGAGNYRALIDVTQCDSSKDSANSAGQSSQNQSSGSTMTQYASWTVDSSRASDTSPQIVKAWIHEDATDFEPAKLICAKLSITETVSASNPYGIFTANFASYPEGSSCAGTPLFKGFLKTEKQTATGKVLLKFAIDGGFSEGGKTFSFNERAVLDRASGGSSGSGTISLSNSFAGNTKAVNFDIAFNSNNFLRNDGTCLDRNNFNETAWRYGMYSAAGARITRSSGFPIRYITGGKNYQGWVGYWGVWLPEGVTPNNGETVYKQTYGSGGGTETAYTLSKVGGKLKKHTKHTVTLSAIKNIPLEWQNPSDSKRYRTKWDGTNLVIFATMNQNDWVWKDVAQSNMSFSSLPFGELNFWSQSLGGQVRIPLANCTWNNVTMTNSCDAPTNSTGIVYFTEDIVYPGDSVPGTLRCYDNCPQYAPAQGGVTTVTANYSPDASGTNYTFSNMVLKDGSNNSLLLTGTSQTNQWGFMSGPLFEATAANLTALACDWNPAQTCGWKAWGALSTYYTWETGTNQWNQFTTLLDSGGTPLKFDAPLQVTYTHSQSDTGARDYKYNGVNFYLDYNGFGDLHGIPAICISMDTGLPTECQKEGEGQIRWVPEFMIAEGATATANDVTYYLKPLEKEQTMKSVATAVCTGAGLATTTYTLPNITDWVDPALGAEPVITAAPAVIGGVVQ